MSNTQIEVHFRNYKLLKEKSIVLDSDKVIYFIKASNNKGKTSMLNALLDIMKANESTSEPITRGEKDMEVTGNIIGGNGKEYTFKYSSELGKKSKFIFVDSDGVPIKKVTEIRDIFNYVHFTPEEFFQWSHTAEGIKKQRQVLLNLLSQEDQNEIDDLQALYNKTNGTKYLARREKNKELDLLNKRLTVVSPEHEAYVKQYNSQKDKLIGYKEETKTLSKQREDFLLKNNPDLKKTLDKSLIKAEADLKDLLKQVELKKKEILDLKTELKTIEIDKDYDVKLKEMDSRLEKLAEWITGGNAYIQACDGVILKLKNREKELREIKDLTEETNDLSTEIDGGQTRINTIISDSPNIPEGLVITDDYITYNGFQFKETELSESQAKLAAAKLSLEINQSPLILLGNAESLGFEVLDQLYELGKEKGRILLFAEHDRLEEDIRLVAYDEIIKPESKKDDGGFPIIK